MQGERRYSGRPAGVQELPRENLPKTQLVGGAHKEIV
jgi:hypothetical protein